VARGAQGGYRGVAAHEADEHTFDFAPQAQTAGDDLVDPRRDEPGATGDDDVRRRAQLRQAADCLQCEFGCGLLVNRHPPRGRGRLRAIEPAPFIEPSVFLRQHRPAVLDSRSRRHPFVELGLAPLAQLRKRPAAIVLFEIEIGNGGRDRGDTGHAVLLVIVSS
jgi:hypothetical protein